MQHLSGPFKIVYNVCISLICIKYMTESPKKQPQLSKVEVSFLQKVMKYRRARSLVDMLLLHDNQGSWLLLIPPALAGIIYKY